MRHQRQPRVKESLEIEQIEEGIVLYNELAFINNKGFEPGIPQVEP